MNNLGNNGADRASEYIDVVRGIWPLLLFAGAIAVASSARQMKKGYTQRTLKQKIVTIFLNSVLTASIAVSCALLLPLFVPDVTSTMQVAVSVGLSCIGGEAVKSWILKKLGLVVVDLMDPHDINTIRVSMTPEQRVEHVRNCPFKHDECREPCRNCPEVRA